MFEVTYLLGAKSYCAGKEGNRNSCWVGLIEPFLPDVYFSVDQIRRKFWRKRKWSQQELSGQRHARGPSSLLVSSWVPVPTLDIERQVVLGGGLRTTQEARVCSVMNFCYCQMLKTAWAWPLKIIRRDLSRAGHRVIGTRVQVSCCHCKKQIGKGSKRLTGMIGGGTNPPNRVKQRYIEFVELRKGWGVTWSQSPMKILMLEDIYFNK